MSSAESWTEIQSTNGSTEENLPSKDNPVKRSWFQKVYNAFGFSKGYNFTFYFICVGALFGFGISRLQDLDYFERLPNNLTVGFWYYLSKPGLARNGMFIHVAAAVPIAILQAFQFTPIIRHKFTTFHRINGYVILVLLLVSNAGCAMLTGRPAAFDLSMQTSMAAAIALTTFSAAMALWNIKRLQIDQHRAWVIRTVVYLGSAVSFRCIVLPATAAITGLGGFYAIWPCDQVAFTLQQFGMAGALTQRYPQCQAGNSTQLASTDVLVKAAWDNNAPESKGAATSILFGPVFWLCILLHLVLAELYLALTPREAQRLREISYEKQVKAGFLDAGNSGSSVERWGDAEKWKPVRESSTQSYKDTKDASSL